MPVEEVSPFLSNLLGGGLDTGFFIKVFVVLFVIFYAVFSLIIFRQIQLMDRAIPTSIGPFLKFIGILQIGVSLAFLFIVIGAF